VPRTSPPLLLRVKAVRQCQVEDTVLGLWEALSARELGLAEDLLPDDCIYLDVPVGRPRGAWSRRHRQRIRIAFDALESYENSGVVTHQRHRRHVQHHEEWQPTGESAVNKFVTVHRVRTQDHPVEGLLDMGALANFAPPTWQDDLMKADMS